MKPVPEFTPGRTLGRADDWNARLAELVRLAGRQVTGGVLEEMAGGGLYHKPAPERFVRARILGGTNPYAWEWLRPAAGGTWETPNPGRSGTQLIHPAYEVGGNTAVPDGAIVKLRRGYGRIVGDQLSQEWLFSYCCTPQIVPEFPSGSGSGGGAPLAIIDCFGTLVAVPKILYATLAGVGGLCTVNDGLTIPLYYDEGGTGWIGYWFAGTFAGQTIQHGLWLRPCYFYDPVVFPDACAITTVNLGGGLTASYGWELTYSVFGTACNTHAVMGESCSYSPFSLSFSNLNQGGNAACCGGDGGTMDAIVTE